MKKIEFTVKMQRIIPPQKQKTVLWEGYDVGIPGLAVCRIPRILSGNLIKGSGWRVVHMNSGRFIGFSCLNRRKDAAEFAERLGTICSWLKPRIDLIEYVDEIEAVINGFAEENAAAVSAPKRGGKE